jgi:hypothetical protein
VLISVILWYKKSLLRVTCIIFGAFYHIR